MTQARNDGGPERGGGRGTRPRRKFTARVPIGIEKVLYLAATNASFRRRLTEDRAGAVAAAKVRLTEAERATLLAVPTRALETMIDGIRPAEHGKRRFMRTIAGATVSLAASVAAEGCIDATPAGIQSDIPGPDDAAAVEDGGGDEVDVALPTEVEDGMDAEVEPWDTAEVPMPDIAAEGSRPDDDAE